MASEVEKVGVDNADDGGQQPDTQENAGQTDQNQTDAGVEIQTDPAGAEPTSAPANTGGGEATGDDSNEAAGGADSGKPRRDNGKIDFPIADAQYRNEAGEVVTAATTEEVTADDGVKTNVAKLIAVPRPIFDEDGEVDATTGKKPVLFVGWNHRKHNPLKKGDFTDEAEYVNYTAFTFRIKAAIFMEKAKVAELRAARLKKFGNMTQRKTISKILKMQEQLALLTKQAEAENIDISSLDD